MYRIGICDDEPLQVEFIKEFLVSFGEDTGLELTIFTALNGEGFIKIIEENYLDIIFLDIEMDKLNGLEVGKIARKKMEDAVILFITGFKDYALDSYSIKALDYIIKPVTLERLKEAFLDAKKRVDDNRFIKENEKNFVIKHKEGMISLRYNDIYYFEKNGKNMNIVCKDDTFTFRSTIKELMDIVQSNDFVQCHQGYLINLNKITNRKENALIFGDIDTIIPIGKTYKKNVLEAIEQRLLRW